MSQKRLSMRKIREVLRLKFELGLNNRQIAASCKVSHVTVGKYLARFSKAGLSWPLPDEMDDGEFMGRLFGDDISPAQPSRPMPDLATMHRELRRKGVTLQLLWQEYREVHHDGYGYTQFCEYYHRFKKVLHPSLRQEYRDCAVILNSAYATYKSDFQSWLADAYIMKSSDLEPLKDKVKYLLTKGACSARQK